MNGDDKIYGRARVLLLSENQLRTTEWGTFDEAQQ